MVGFVLVVVGFGLTVLYLSTRVRPCPQCGNTVGRKVPKCPACGAPVASERRR